MNRYRVISRLVAACVLAPLLATSCAQKPAPIALDSVPSAYDFTQGTAHAPAGVYADPASKTCCLVGSSATIPLTIPPQSTNVTITFYQPLLKLHPSAQGEMVVTFDGVSPVAIANLTPGLHVESIPVPANALRRSTLELGLAFPKTFVPKDEGMGADTRHLSIVLRSVAFSNDSPPTSYDFSGGSTGHVPDGVFADTSTACCFVGPATTVPLTLPANATKLDIGFYEPSLPAHPNHVGTMIVSLNGTLIGTIPDLKSGYHLVTIPLPKSDQHKKTLTLGLRFLNTFVPKNEKMGTDPRVLSIVLRKVYFQ